MHFTQSSLSPSQKNENALQTANQDLTHIRNQILRFFAFPPGSVFCVPVPITESYQPAIPKIEAVIASFKYIASRLCQLVSFDLEWLVKWGIVWRIVVCSRRASRYVHMVTVDHGGCMKRNL